MWTRSVCFVGISCRTKTGVSFFSYWQFLFSMDNFFPLAESQFHCHRNLHFCGQFPCLWNWKNQGPYVGRGNKVQVGWPSILICMSPKVQFLFQVGRSKSINVIRPAKLSYFQKFPQLFSEVSPTIFRSFPNAGFEMVPVFVCLMMALPHPLKEDGWALHTNAAFLTVVTVKINMIKGLFAVSYTHLTLPTRSTV